MPLQTGNWVRRKHDHSGRVRRVGSVQTDADGKRFVTLNNFLDGWLIWAEDELVAVPQKEMQHGTLKHTHQKTSPRARVANRHR